MVETFFGWLRCIAFVTCICNKVCWLCRWLFLCIVTDILLELHKQVCHGLVTDFVANTTTCWDGLCPRLSWFVLAPFTETSWFHDLSPFVSTTFMICVHTFPHREVSVKVGVMEFGLYDSWLVISSINWSILWLTIQSDVASELDRATWIFRKL